MLTESQYRGAAVGMSSRVCNSKQVCFQHGTEASQRTGVVYYECHSVVSSRRSEPPHRTLAWLSQCVSTAQRDAERRWTAETASSLDAVGVRPCTAERKSTEPCAWCPLFCTGCAVRQAANEETLVAVWRGHICAADRWPGLFDDCSRSIIYHLL